MHRHQDTTDTPTANLEEVEDASDVDEETYGHLHKEIEKAERDGHDQGKPGSFLNRLIQSGNKKTEEQMARDDLAIREKALGSQKS